MKRDTYISHFRYDSGYEKTKPGNRRVKGWYFNEAGLSRALCFQRPFEKALRNDEEGDSRRQRTKRAKAVSEETERSMWLGGSSQAKSAEMNTEEAGPDPASL